MHSNEPLSRLAHACQMDFKNHPEYLP